MKRNKIKYDRWLRMLFLSFALLMVGGMAAWGQTYTGPVTDESQRPKVTLKGHIEQIDGKNIEWHDSVFYETKTIYVWPDKQRELFIPELRINVRAGDDERLNWFVHWYVVKGNVKFTFPKNLIIQESISRLQGGYWSGTVSQSDVVGDWGKKEHRLEDYFVKAEKSGGEDYGWVWSTRIREKIWGHSKSEIGGGFGMDASTINISCSNSDLNNDIEIWCDVSFYQDGAWDTNGPTYTEPTLTKRYKYQIKNAQTESIADSLKIYEFDYPYKEDNKTINFTMPYSPDNYFWGNGIQGTDFEYKVWLEDENEPEKYEKFRLVTRSGKSLPKQQTQRIAKSEHYDPKKVTNVKVRVVSNPVGNTTGDVAHFIFKPVVNSNFELESSILDKNDRWPRKNTTQYEMIGHVSFDNEEYEKEKIKLSELKGSEEKDQQLRNNMSNNPLGYFSQNLTDYGFLKKGAYTLFNKDKGFTSNQNVYGLFRSANKYGVSKDGTECGSGDFWTRNYLWIPSSIKDNNTDYYANEYLLDRTYEVTKGTSDEHCGYFYYIDASNDPGTLVQIPVDNICDHTELTVTAWVADMTRSITQDVDGVGCNPLAPNINLIFRGIDNSNNEHILHQFTSCDALVDYGSVQVDDKGNTVNEHYNKNLMKWQQLCYSFVVKDLKECVKFYVEVQNNEPHTDGADYAIDDIRIFKTKPQVRLVQAGNLCDTEIKSVRFVTDYDVALANLGLINQLPEYSVTKDEVSKLPEDHSFRQWLEKQNNQDDILRTFTKIYYSLYKSDKDGNVGSLVKIDYSGDGEGEIYRVSYISTNPDYMEWTGTGVTEGFVSSAEIPIKEGELVPDQYYKARLSMAPPAENDDVSSPCALVGDPFQLIVANKIYDIVNQENQSVDLEDVRKGEVYTLKGKLSYKESDVSTEFKEIESPKFDWFIGDLDEFEASGAINFDGKSYSIKEALIEMNNPNEKDKGNSIKELLTKKLGVYNKDKSPSGRLVFGTSSFEYYAIKKYQTVIALASQYQSEEISIEKKKLFCTDPVVIPLGGTPPTITPGDPDVPEPDPTDPDNPDNPQPDKDPETDSYVRSVRVGLIQLQDMAKGGGTLRIPIHARKSRDNEMFYADKDNVNIILRETSDKEAQLEKGKSIATLAELVDENAQKATWSNTYLKIKFSSDDVAKMREGFWYMVEIPYGVCDREDNSLDKLHFGSFKLTLKIVPEYVTWVGREKEMHNWNNDDLNHWRRSNDNELYTKDVANKNGSHNEAYTPMRFTKVTIHGKATSDEKVGDAYAAYPHLYKLKKNTDAQKKDPNKVLLNMDPDKFSNEIGVATKNIEYDLLADPDYEVELNGKLLNPLEEHSYACVRFYGNACDEIYIKPESEILHTEYLTYNKAHVDYEMDPNRWYMLASPLKGVVSGDMYLPTGKNNIGKYARQETPAFGEIYYNNIDYTRWTPAVYMRGWNNSSVDVIYPNGVAHYGVSANWSNLYNDVDVSFAPGTGFSIGTKTTTDDKVLFRLPKADTMYSYYNGAGDSEDSKTLIEKNRQGKGRFYFSPNEKGEGEVTSLETNTTGMVGNPFMSHLDMKEFFKINPRSNDTYYILDGNTTIANIVSEKYELSTESDYDPNYVAPLQSFIKKDLDKATFTTDMIAKAPTSGKNVGLRSATAAASEKTLPQLRITASRGGVHNTALVAGLVTASDSYIEGEDAALLINEEVAAPQVYTLAGNQMTAINVTPELKDIPVGIYGKDDSPVELSFKLSGDMQNVKLVDKQSGKVYPVTDGLTLTVSGNISGRYFLNGSIATSNEVIARNEIVCYANGNGQIVVSSVDPLTRISVYSVSGQRLRYLDNLNMQTVYVKDLAPGIYIVKAESVTQVCSEKMEVK